MGSSLPVASGPISGSGTPRGPLRWFVLLACGVVIVAGLKIAKPLIVPLIFAAFLSLMSYPAVAVLHRRKVPTLVSVPLVVMVVVAGVGLIGGFVGGQVNRFMAEADKYQASLDGLVTGISHWLQGHGVQLTDSTVASFIDTGAVTRFVGTTLTGVAGLLSDLMLVVFTMVFILFEATTFSAKIREAMGNPTADLSRFQQVATDVNRYVFIKTYVSLATGAVVGLFLWAMGVDFPFLWGLLAFLLNYVPNIGSALAAIPAVLLTFVQYGPARGLVVLLAYVAVNTLVGNVIEPWLMGRRLGLSALVVFLSLVFWGWLWGPVGMLLSVPLTMIVKILLENGQWNGVAVMLGGDPEKEKEPPVSLRSRR